MQISVEAEREFSAAGVVCTNLRSRLAHDLMTPFILCVFPARTTIKTANNMDS